LILAALAFGYALTLGGWRPVVLLSGSMAPTAPAGSLVLTVPTQVQDVHVGDVIVIHPPGLDKPVTHRIVALEPSAGGVLATTQGDANPVPDPEAARLSGSVPRVVFVVPRLGQWLLRLGPVGALCLAVSGFAAAELIRMAIRASTSWNAGR
jgi:signal peptidase